MGILNVYLVFDCAAYCHLFKQAYGCSGHNLIRLQTWRRKRLDISNYGCSALSIVHLQVHIVDQAITAGSCVLVKLMKPHAQSLLHDELKTHAAS